MTNIKTFNIIIPVMTKKPVIKIKNTGSPKKGLVLSPGETTIPESGPKNQINKIIKETALRAVTNIQTEYKRRKRGLENEMNKMMESLKKEKQTIARERQSLETEKNEFKKEIEKQKAEILKTKKELTVKIHAEEKARWEKMLKEKENSLIEQEKKYLENLINSLETEN